MTQEAQALRDSGAALFVEPCSAAPTAAAASTAGSSGAASLIDPSGGTVSLSCPTHVVPAGVWFGARIVDDAEYGSSDAVPAASAASSSAAPCSVSPRRHGYSLVSCVVSPAFLFSEFELMQPKEVARLRVAEQMADRVRQQRRVANNAGAEAGAAGSAAPPATMSEQVERRKIDRLHKMVLRD